MRRVHSRERSERVAWWTTGPGTGELRAEPLRDPGAGEVLVRTLWTGISRGTETLVLRGEVPASERDRMRAPFQEGAFPFPVKYGYLTVGVVEGGPLDGRTVFSLAPHQSRSVLPADAVTPVPAGVPARRAVLAGAVETAVNVLWDAAPRLGDRVTVVGAGMIGCSIARLAAGIPGVEVELVDVDRAKAPMAAALGAAFASPDDATPDRDIVIEASASPAGLALALRLAATDSDVVVASWFGSRPVPLELGADFHSRRLTLRSSQVGAVASARRERRTMRQRLALALELLADPAFDVLLSGPSPYTALPDVAAALAAGTDTGLCHTIDWSAA
ncbi:zinc-binding alcohol dehydrogenase [Pseudolysinimonas kribbensis]|uniref:zinc-dependent alcohol dehydrogenase n=1 Tax=Pseudolysinimonas kribbensis TaxID=433641 RepID=UPI0031DE9B02